VRQPHHRHRFHAVLGFRSELDSKRLKIVNAIAQLGNQKSKDKKRDELRAELAFVEKQIDNARYWVVSLWNLCKVLLCHLFFVDIDFSSAVIGASSNAESAFKWLARNDFLPSKGETDQELMHALREFHPFILVLVRAPNRLAIRIARRLFDLFTAWRLNR
jgi:hypothetical protein